MGDGSSGSTQVTAFLGGDGHRLPYSWLPTPDAGAAGSSFRSKESRGGSCSGVTGRARAVADHTHGTRGLARAGPPWAWVPSLSPATRDSQVGGQSLR